MIVRERNDSFVMIEQHHHAEISANLMKRWNNSSLIKDPMYSSIMYAIANHDLGWMEFDKQPFWNDKKKAPYTFIDFPTPTKSVLYKYGIDEVEKRDAYAALLCSEHYSRFMEHSSSKEAKQFVMEEKQRRERIIVSLLPTFNENTFIKHYEYVKFADNLSLYICLNEPGTTLENEHPFFRSGIPVASSILGDSQEGIRAYWENDGKVVVSPFLFLSPFHVTIRQKALSKQTILEHGLLDSYAHAPYENHQIEFVKP